ncbi:MAG TPA: helix-turn-helix transcriptional regulator [Kiloniellales bacterium]|jgi:transcriptional regulator with XRE-family HTH domain|nr:helix-turn-helix transcriptional regulator [Kiloniellales bacterium]
MERAETVEQFRQRLLQVIEQTGLTRSAFAQLVGLDRSTLTQLLSPENQRLPRAETVVAIARQAQVSCDWLLGVSQEARRGAELVQAALEIEAGASSPMDARLQRWHAEAAGYKIRYVPTTLPDLLKTEEVIRYEYGEQGDKVHERQLEQSEARLAYSRRPETEIEVCCSLQTIEAFARGETIWRDLPLPDRRDQLEKMIELVDELYPTFRLFLYDGRQRYSAPMNVFGPMRATLYVGDMFFVFNATEQIRVLTRHFDQLIRAAVVQPTDVSDFLQQQLLHLEESSGKNGERRTA